MTFIAASKSAEVVAGASIASRTDEANAAMALSAALRRRMGVDKSGALDDKPWAGAAHCSASRALKSPSIDTPGDTSGTGLAT
jgi:hypothetical protein